MNDEERYEQLSKELGLKLAKEAIQALSRKPLPRNEDECETVVLYYKGKSKPRPWNPPLPDGARYMHQSEVTSEIAKWASGILSKPHAYPMHCMVRIDKLAALVQWHTFQGATGKHGLFRGVSLIVFEK